MPELTRDDNGLSPEVQDFLTNWDWDDEPIDPAELTELLEEWLLNDESVNDLTAKIGIRGFEQMAVWILERYYSEV